MATSVYPAQGGAVGVTETKDGSGNATFIPQLWSNEVIAERRRNLVIANFVKNVDFNGKKGDTLYFPKPSLDLVAQDKAENTAVTIQNFSNDRIALTFDKHKEVSYHIEDIVGVQANDSMRREYTSQAGYALAKQLDDDLFELGKSLGDGDGSDWTHSRSFMFTSGGALTAYDGLGSTNAEAFADEGFRRAIQYLDDSNVPQEGRVLVIPPSVRNTLNGLARYTEQAFVGEVGGNNTIRNGEVGNLYGIPVVVSSNCPVVDTTGRACMLLHKSAFMLGTQMDVRSQSQYKQEFLAHLYTSDMLYATQVARPDSGVALIVDN
jgi:N4-gp56 family major capsid protein